MGVKPLSIEMEMSGVETFPSTMQNPPLTVSALLRYGRDVYPQSEVSTFCSGLLLQKNSFRDLASRMSKFANALSSYGIGRGDRVGCMAWNTEEHFEAYFAVPAMGAVLHSINARLSDDQLVFVINDAQDKIVIADEEMLPRLLSLFHRFETVDQIVTVNSGSVPSELPRTGMPSWTRYEDFIGDHGDDFEWPEIAEDQASTICYTTGTTGRPKGVVYSHRSVWLHALTIASGSALSVSQYDSVLQVTPMFHVNGWGLPYAAWMMGANVLLPGRDVSSHALSTIIEDCSPTVAVGVPLIWNELANYAEATPVNLSSIRLIASAGSSVSEALIDRYERLHDVTLVQGWGMTEVSPWGGLAFPDKSEMNNPDKPWRRWSGRVLPGLEIRAIDAQGNDVPRDGITPGEMLIRGPWVTNSYRGPDVSPESFSDGWFYTGDICAIDARGYFKVTDRAKDIIKSGGEWISTVALEDLCIQHPSVAAAAVIGIPDERWDERPLAFIVPKEHTSLTSDELCDFLGGRIPKWWMPSAFAFVEELPRTSVGKLDKKQLRIFHSTGAFDIDVPSRSNQNAK